MDTSDHEVNIKILLDSRRRRRRHDRKQRNELLAEMTDEVGALVLRDNYEQNVALANAWPRPPACCTAQQRFMRRLEREGHLDRELEFLPNDRQIRDGSAPAPG